MENTISVISNRDSLVVEDILTPTEGGFKFKCTVYNPKEEILGFELKVKIAVDEISKAYVLCPGAVYDGNKADIILPDLYPPRLKEFKQTNPNGPIIMADIPRYDNGLAIQTYELSMPACGIYYDDQKYGIIFKMETGNVENPYGFSFDNKSVTLCFPCIRNRRYRHCAKYEDSPDVGLTLKRDESKTFECEVIYSMAKDRPDFAYEIVCVNGTEKGETKYDYQALTDLCINKINNNDYDDTNGFYMDSGESRRFQVGWVGGMITAYAMMLTGDQKALARAISTVEFVIYKGVSQCGLPYGIYSNNEWNGIVKTDGIDFAARHIRRIVDGVFYMFKILKLNILSDKFAADLEKAASTACDRLVEMVKIYGHFGHSIDFKNGEILWGGSAAGVTGISCLCSAFQYFGGTKYLESAETAGDYYKIFNDKGAWTGGPGDIMIAPDSESNYAAMEAFYQLYKCTGSNKWKNEFIKSTKLMTTWVCMVNFDFPINSPYGKLNTKTRGLVMANSQNKTLAPGVCTSSAAMFTKAFELTGDKNFVTIKKMILDGASGIARDFQGFLPEDINATDSLCERGELYADHGIWTETAYILMNLEGTNG